MSGFSANGRAAGLMTQALKRMAHDYPFHAALIAALRVGPSDETATMAVTVRDGQVALLYDPAFVAGCTADERVNVLCHEANHVLFGHPFADPARFPDRRARVIAEEVTVNEWIPGPLPGRPITLAQFPVLPPDEDTDTRYRRLAGAVTPSPPGSSASAAPAAGSGVPRPDSGVPKNNPTVPKPGSAEPENGTAAPSGRPDGPSERGTPTPTDDHHLWGEARAAAVAGTIAVKAAVDRAWRGLTPEQRERVPAGLRTRIDDLGRGHGPGRDTERVERPAEQGQVDWRTVLRRFIRATVPQPSMQRPPRRFPRLAGIVPGRAYRPHRARVMAVIDTSGSVGSAALRAIAAELHRMGTACDVTVVECDAKVQAVYPLAGPLETVQGRGGTDLRPPFDPGLLRRVRPDAVVYFTDGRGPAPERPPSVPVVWCLTARGIRPATWGRVIPMTAQGGP